MHLIARIRRAARYREPEDVRVAACIARLTDAGMACGSVHLKDLAAEIGIDHTHLGRLVRAQTGLGFVGWRRGLRLRPAVHRLLEGNEPIQNIALDCGFGGLEGAAHFSDVVHEVLGASPTDLRTCVREWRDDPCRRRIEERTT